MFDRLLHGRSDFLNLNGCENVIYIAHFWLKLLQGVTPDKVLQITPSKH